MNVSLVPRWRRCQHVPALFLLMIMVFWLLGVPKHHDHEVGGVNERPIWDDCPG
jgi:hypothetical protein